MGFLDKLITKTSKIIAKPLLRPILEHSNVKSIKELSGPQFMPGSDLYHASS